MRVPLSHLPFQSPCLSSHKNGGSRIYNDKNSALFDVGQRGCSECNSNHEQDMLSTVIMTVRETSLCGLDLPSDNALFYTEFNV